MRPATNRWIVSAIWLGLMFQIVCARAARLEFAGQAITIAGRLTPGDETRFARMAGLQGPGRVSFVYLAGDGGDVSVATAIARRIRADGLTTVADASRFLCVDACVAMFIAGARRLYLHAPSVSGPAGVRDFRGIGFAARGEGASELAAALTELGAARSVPLIGRAKTGEIYRISGDEALATGVATAVTPK